MSPGSRLGLSSLPPSSETEPSRALTPCPFWQMHHPLAGLLISSSAPLGPPQPPSGLSSVHTQACRPLPPALRNLTFSHVNQPGLSNSPPLHTLQCCFSSEYCSARQPFQDPSHPHRCTPPSHRAHLQTAPPRGAGAGLGVIACRGLPGLLLPPAQGALHPSIGLKYWSPDWDASLPCAGQVGEAWRGAWGPLPGRDPKSTLWTQACRGR